MPWSDAKVSRPLPMHLVFHKSERSSEKFFVGVLANHFQRLSSQLKKTGTKGCILRKAQYAYPTSGTVTTTVLCLAKTQTNSGLNERGELLPGPTETYRAGHVSFGFGRRICVGKNLANESLFINTARILWAAKLEPRDEIGKNVPLDTETMIDAGLI